jgi:hypothetical protein
VAPTFPHRNLKARYCGTGGHTLNVYFLPPPRLDPDTTPIPPTISNPHLFHQSALLDCTFGVSTHALKRRPLVLAGFRKPTCQPFSYTILVHHAVEVDSICLNTTRPNRLSGPVSRTASLSVIRGLLASIFCILSRAQPDDRKMSDVDLNRRNRKPRPISELERDRLEEFVESIHYSAR